jgi:hypothetical protein
MSDEARGTLVLLLAGFVHFLAGAVVWLVAGWDTAGPVFAGVVFWCCCAAFPGVLWWKDRRRRAAMTGTIRPYYALGLTATRPNPWQDKHPTWSWLRWYFQERRKLTAERRAFDAWMAKHYP